MSDLNMYFNLDLYDEAEKKYTIADAAEGLNVDADSGSGYSVQQFNVPANTVDMEIDFTSIGALNLLVLRTDAALAVKLNANTNVGMSLNLKFPTVLYVGGITKIFVTNADPNEAATLNIFAAKVDS